MYLHNREHTFFSGKTFSMLFMLAGMFITFLPARGYSSERIRTGETIELPIESPADGYAIEWQKISTSHFELFYQQSDRALTEYIMENIEKDYKRIVRDIGMDPGITVKIYLAPDRDTYKLLQPEGMKTYEWSIGVYYPGRNLIVMLSPKAQKVGHPDLRQIMAHELTHFILHTITRHRGVELPAWLHEGLAMYESREWNLHHQSLIARISLTRTFIPLSRLVKRFPDDQITAERAYAQSMSLIAYIINKHGLSSLHDIINLLISGKNTEDAFSTVLGSSLKNFEKQWHAYLRLRYTWIPIITSSFSIWLLITLMVIVIYAYKRRKSKQKMELWEIEDQIDSMF